MTSQAQVIKTRLPNPPPPVEVLLKTVHAAVEELKAKDVVEIDVRGKSSVTDFMVIASGTSTRHVKSIADEVVKFAKNLDVQPLGVEGEREAEWVLVDLGDVVVHVMLPRVREFYALERLWTVGDQPPSRLDAGEIRRRRRVPNAACSPPDRHDEKKRRLAAPFLFSADAGRLKAIRSTTAR